MNDNPDHTDVPIGGPTLVEIDAEKIAQVILEVRDDLACGRRTSRR